MEHEHDTVLQLQEVIEQLRNVFPSEPGEFILAAQLFGSVVPPALCSSITHRREQQICTAEGRQSGGDTVRLNGSEEEKDKEKQCHREKESVSVTHVADWPVAFKTQFA